jgi:hypothetical protein
LRYNARLDFYAVPGRGDGLTTVQTVFFASSQVLMFRGKYTY